MRTCVVFAALLATACIPQEPSFDGALQHCADASMGACLRGPAGSCDVRDRVPEECGLIPPCGCECPSGYVREADCGG